MEAVRQSWTDERLDDLNRRVDDGFRRIDDRFGGIDARLDGMHRTMVHGVIAIFGAMVAGFAGVMGLIATQL
jgi:hypothetical protein